MSELLTYLVVILSWVAWYKLGYDAGYEKADDQWWWKVHSHD